MPVGDRKVCIAFGKKWYRYPFSKKAADRKYFQRYGVWLHRYTWEQYYGPIPEGYHIHHKNHITTDNRIENLECVTPWEHAQRHPEKKPICAENGKKNYGKMCEGNEAWRKSEEGREWRRGHLAEALSNIEPVQKICKCCGKPFETKISHQDFCSNKCRSKARRDSGVDNETRTCPVCGKTFVCNKYSRTKTCSRACSKEMTK